MRLFRFRRLVAALSLFAGAAVALPAAAAPAPLTVLAAASLKDALNAAVKDWSKTSDVPVRVSYAGTPALAKQIEAGAPADVFISADLDWMDREAKKGLIVAATRQDLLGNSLVLAAGADSGIAPVTITKSTDFKALLGGGKLAMALVDSVPAGKYGKQALTALGQWDAVQPSVVQAENVRVALAYVARGEAKFGIVYSTDAAIEPKVKIVGTFPASSHPAIIYPIAVLKSSTEQDAATRFVHFLEGPDAQKVFFHYGFVKPADARGS
ncbi:MAG TPA: molybdate ABC transporter substrate-binding protein [Hyphomicrobiales bacterium]|nr:molybdate ABC transporter substrate-binding protein [Hyphomicrobiales bacterium]